MNETQPTHFVVVDDYEPCPCHTVLVVRQMNNPYKNRVWVCFNIKNPCRAGFGDRIEWNFGSNDVFIVRNEKLKFRLQIDKMPLEYVAILYDQLPYSFMYDEVVLLFPNKG